MLLSRNFVFDLWIGDQNWRASFLLAIAVTPSGVRGSPTEARLRCCHEKGASTFEIGWLSATHRWDDLCSSNPVLNTPEEPHTSCESYSDQDVVAQCLEDVSRAELSMICSGPAEL